MNKKNNDKTNEKITTLQEKVEQLEEQWRRALADYANLEKRVGREREKVRQFATESLVDKLLFVFDDLQRACQNNADKGLEMIKEDFWEVLNTEGIEKIATEGEEFDPNLMDAVEMSDGEKNKVTTEVSSGYTYEGRCIRPAKVKVGQGKPLDK